MKLSLFAAIVALLIFADACTRGGPPDEPVPLSAATCASFMKGKTEMNLKQVLTCTALICATYPTACQPTPRPSGTGGAAPFATGGSGPGTGGGSATGGMAPIVGQFPVCNPPTLAGPNPKKLEDYRRSLKPRHKVTERAAPFQGIVTAPPTSVMWNSNDAFCGNQGSVGACVAFTALDVATTKPFTLSYATQALFNKDALDAYKWITNNDPYPGAWPQQDTGSDTLTGCKWLVMKGYAKSCTVLSGKSQVLAALQKGPVMSGMNWLSSMFTTDNCGRLTVSGTVQGGHDIEIVGYDAATDEEIEQNHWDNDFAAKTPDGHGGYMRMKSSDLFGAILDADFVQPEL